MSARKGDKARHNRIRLQKLNRQTRMRELKKKLEAEAAEAKAKQG